VYLLTPDLRERFRLEHVPAVVEAKDQQFVIREFKVGSEVVNKLIFSRERRHKVGI